ncbi:MAG: hypothetical protein J6A75_11465, partial [Lachnospiraceae bacterium]|nr:hypothetical protein [Lachnospiraceae bacterium]
VLDLLNILLSISGKLPRMAILGETAMEGGLSRRVRYQYHLIRIFSKSYTRTTESVHTYTYPICPPQSKK